MRDVSGGLQGLAPVAKIAEFEFVSKAGLELRVLDVDTTDPVPVALQSLDKVVTDKAAGTGDQNAIARFHVAPHFISNPDKQIPRVWKITTLPKFQFLL